MQPPRRYAPPPRGIDVPYGSTLQWGVVGRDDPGAPLYQISRCFGGTPRASSPTTRDKM